MLNALNVRGGEEYMSLSLLAEMIYRHSGLNYKNNLFTLEPKVAKRFKELGLDCDSYLDYLKRRPSEWQSLMQHVTINETYFFREEAQMNEWLAIAGQIPAGREIRIWSAACSTGEEPYSIAMLSKRTGIAQRNPVRILGSDINLRVIKTASEAFYPSSSLCFRRTSEAQKSEYFEREEGGFRVRKDIRDLVEFREINLLNAQQVDSVGSVDAIFCRNVMIYFDMDTVQEVVRRFHRILKPGGHLFLGHAETLRGTNTGFESVKAKDTFFYRKE